MPKSKRVIIDESSSSIEKAANKQPTDKQISVKKKAVYHTINGFRIDLNVAAEMHNYYLPNGKLIQVRKQSNLEAAAAAAGQSNEQEAVEVQSDDMNKQK